MITTPRRALVAAAVAAAVIPAAPALAQTATPTPSASSTPTPSATPTPTPTAIPTEVLDGISVSRPLIDVGQTVDVTVNGVAGTQVGLFLGNFRAPQGRQIRTGTIAADGRFTWTGLRPEDSSVFFVRVAGTTLDTPQVTVRVRRTVTLGVEQRTRGIYTFSGQITRAEAGVQVTVARLDDQTKRVTGVASTRTDAAGRYEISTSLPQGLAGYYAIAQAASGLDAGRSRLYGLLVNTRPSAARASAPVAQSISLDVGRSSGNVYIFSGAVRNGANVPVTLARVSNGRLVGVAGGRTAANGGYVFRVPVAAGTSFFQVLTATARSRVYGLVVPQSAVPACSATSVRRSHDDSAQCMFRAYRRGDWAAVSNYALPPVVALLRRGRAYDVQHGFNWTYEGCGRPEFEDLSDFPPASSGVACTFYANANPGEVHGVTIEFNMDRYFRAESYTTVG